MLIVNKLPDKHQPGTVFITYRIQPLSVGPVALLSRLGI